MITDLVQISVLSEKNRDQNFRFRTYLKNHDYDEERFRRIGEEIQNQLDCRACANCCRVASVKVSDRDVERLVDALKISREQFVAEYTVWNEAENTRDLRRVETGCAFLSGNDCTVYEDRPDICRNFPYVVSSEGRIDAHMFAFIERTSYCPISYNALEAYKKESGFRRRRR
jgi:Fe-S-cluster containining protein